MKSIVREMLEGDWVDRSLLGAMALVMTAIIWLLIFGVRTMIFESTHECIRSGRYWGYGHMVGVVGKGGYYQPAGWRFVCYEWSPDDREPELW